MTGKSTAMQSAKPKARDVFIVDGARTPFLKALKGPGAFTGADLAVRAGQALLKRQPFSPAALDEVILGSALASPDEANIARVASLRMGCGHQVTAWTVQRNCASGMQALDSACKDIAYGRHDLILAGGSDAMSHAPLLFNQRMVRWLAKWMGSKTPLAKLKLLGQLRPNYFAPVIALLRGLTDPTVGLSMGQTAEELAYHYQIDRDQMDQFAVESHTRLHHAQTEGYLSEIIPLYDDRGNCYQQDDGVRPDSSLAKLGKLKPYFDKRYGMVTPGNSSQVTDGAALLLLASADAVKRYQLPVKGRIVDIEWAGLDPAQMGLGPIYAMTPLLQRHHLSVDDIDNWEINEAFAAQVIACQKLWQDADFCRQQLGLQAAFGEIDRQKLNVDGGAIAVGHPIGATGARLVLHSLNTLRRQGGQYGVASLCIGGGQGGAVLIEALS